MAAHPQAINPFYRWLTRRRLSVESENLSGGRISVPDSTSNPLPATCRALLSALFRATESDFYPRRCGVNTASRLCLFIILSKFSSRNSEQTAYFVRDDNNINDSQPKSTTFCIGVTNFLRGCVNLRKIHVLELRGFIKNRFSQILYSITK